MKQRRNASLRNIVFRFVLLGILISTFTLNNMSIVHAMGEISTDLIPEAAEQLTDAGISAEPTNAVDDHDCEDDDDRRGAVEPDSGDCYPRVRVTAVWTADGNLNPKTSFVSGEAIQWVITVKNTTRHTASVKLFYDVKDPSGQLIHHFERTISAKAGLSYWAISGVVSNTPGSYTFIGSAKYHGFLTRKLTRYDVSKACYTLTTSSDPAAGGTVHASPAPDCNGGTQYTDGIVVTLTASANAGYAFSSWTGDAGGSANPVTVTMTANRSVTANFTAVCYSLATSVNPAGSGTVDASPAPDCNGATQYSHGTVVALTATANTDYVFSSWNGDASGSSNPVNVTMTADRSVTANFAQQIILTTGTYDDNHAAWSYTGNWSTATNAGYYGGSLHESMTAGDYATVMVNGTQFSIYFAEGPTYGKLDVYVDGVLIGTINQFNTTTAYQSIWTSPLLTPGVHTLKFVHLDGAAANIDAIQVNGSVDIVAPATISDLAAVTGATAGTVDLSWTAPGDDNNTGTAASYLVRYSTAAITDETAWNAATPVTSGVPTPSVAGSSQTMTVSGLMPGATYYFAVRAQDEQPNLGGLSNSPSAAARSTTPMPVGKYDDMDPAWSYTGNWAIHTGSGPYANTLHYTREPGATATFIFQAPARFILTYTAAYNRGDLLVSVDGGTPATINAYDPGVVWQQTYASALYADSGVHTVTIENVNVDGTYIDLDAIEIVGPSMPVGAGTYDDMNAAWTYTGNWATYAGSGPYASTLHYSNIQNASASLTFTGTQFTVIFTKHPNRGEMEVWIDGALAYTFSETGSTLAWQQTWTLPAPLSAGTHTVMFRNPNTSASIYIDIDAITILP